MSTRQAPRSVDPRTRTTLLEAGVSRHVLVGPRFRRTSPGRYVPADVDQTCDQRLVEAAAHLPVGGALAGWAAARALGASAFDGMDRSLRPQPVPMCLPAEMHRQPTRAFRYVRQSLADDEIVERFGLPVTSPGRTASDLARWAPSLEEAVVAVDVLLEAEVVDEECLTVELSRLAGRRGARQARLAFDLARRGARSPGETRLRLAYVLGLGAPCPLLNRSVGDLAGRLLGIPDLLDEEAGLVMEYDGARWAGSEREAGHRDRVQHREDNVREEGFERHGLIVVRADSADVGPHRTLLIRRLGSARAEGLLRPRGSRRWRLLRER